MPVKVELKIKIGKTKLNYNDHKGTLEGLEYTSSTAQKAETAEGGEKVMEKWWWDTGVKKKKISDRFQNQKKTCAQQKK